MKPRINRITAEQLQPDFYVFTEPWPWDSEFMGRKLPAGSPFVNAYLLIGKERAVLIDDMMSHTDPPLVQAICEITQLPVSVLFTHGHGDHVGHETGVLLEAGFPLYLPDGELDVLLGMEDFMGGVQSWMKKESFRTVRDGERFDLGGTTLECYNTKGHTDGQLCYLDRKGKRVFVGDAFGDYANEFTTLPNEAREPFLKATEEFEQWVDDPDCVMYNGHLFNVDFHPWTIAELRRRRLDMTARLRAGLVPDAVEGILPPTEEELEANT